MGWKHYQTVDHPNWEPQVGRGLFGIRLLILHFKFQFSKSIKSSTFHYFSQFNLSFEKKYLFPKMPKNHPKIYTKPPNRGEWDEQKDLVSLETWPRYRLAERPLSDGKTTFQCNPALIRTLQNEFYLMRFLLFYSHKSRSQVGYLIHRKWTVAPFIHSCHSCSRSRLQKLPFIAVYKMIAVQRPGLSCFLKFYVKQ